MRVVLTREQGLNEALRALIPTGADIREVPITTTDFFASEMVALALSTIAVIDTIAITSARAARYVPLALSRWREASVYCVGDATAAALRELGVEPVWAGKAGAAEMATAITHGPVLFLGAEETRDELAQGLAARGVGLEAVACYRTVLRALTTQEREILAHAQVLFVGAPSAWTAVQGLVSPETVVVTSGETTGSLVRGTHPTVFVGWGEETRILLAELAKTNSQ
jgi:uroporphyrinogen-III synthase